MRVIWVSPTIPHPAEAGGWAHEFELIKELANRHTIDVVSSDQNDPLDHVALRDAGVTLTHVPWRPRSFPRNRLTLAATILRAQPNLTMWLRRDRLPLLASTVRELAERTRADVIHITLGELASLVGEFEVPTGLLLFDSMTRVIEAQLSTAPTALRRAQLRLERRRTQRFEQKWYRRAAGLASVSSVDSEWVERVVGCDVETIEVSVPERFFEPPDRPRSPTNVTFVGTLNHEPNADAITWLCTEIWPLVRTERPDARLVVVGRGDRKGELTAEARVIVEGVGGTLAADVDDVRPFYWEAAVVVAPMRLGAGMRLKVVHAMACRAPMVATPLALEGVPAEAVRHAIVATSRDEIVEGILATLLDPAGAKARADAAVPGVEPLRAEAVADSLEAWWKSFAG